MSRLSTRFYLITGGVIIVFAMISNLAFGLGFEVFEHHGHGYGRH